MSLWEENYKIKINYYMKLQIKNIQENVNIIIF